MFFFFLSLYVSCSFDKGYVLEVINYIDQSIQEGNNCDAIDWLEKSMHYLGDYDLSILKNLSEKATQLNQTEKKKAILKKILLQCPFDKKYIKEYLILDPGYCFHLLSLAYNALLEHHKEDALCILELTRPYIDHYDLKNLIFLYDLWTFFSDLEMEKIILEKILSLNPNDSFHIIEYLKLNAQKKSFFFLKKKLAYYVNDTKINLFSVRQKRNLLELCIKIRYVNGIVFFLKHMQGNNELQKLFGLTISQGLSITNNKLDNNIINAYIDFNQNDLDALRATFFFFMERNDKNAAFFYLTKVFFHKNHTIEDEYIFFDFLIYFLDGSFNLEYYLQSSKFLSNHQKNSICAALLSYHMIHKIKFSLSELDNFLFNLNYFSYYFQSKKLANYLLQEDKIEKKKILLNKLEYTQYYHLNCFIEAIKSAMNDKDLNALMKLADAIELLRSPYHPLYWHYELLIVFLDAAKAFIKGNEAVLSHAIHLLEDIFENELIAEFLKNKVDNGLH